MFAYLGARQRPVFLLVLILATHGIFVAAGQGRDDAVKPTQAYKPSGGSDRVLVPSARFDDPTNAAILDAINAARGTEAPPLTTDAALSVIAAAEVNDTKTGEPAYFKVQDDHGIIVGKYTSDPTKTDGSVEKAVIDEWAASGSADVKGQLMLNEATTVGCAAATALPGRDEGLLVCVFDKAYVPGASAASMPRASVALLVAAVAVTALLA